MHPDDERLANLLRLIRRRNGQTQERLARLAGVPRVDVTRLESGLAGDVKLARIRKVFDAAGGRARLVPWWNGAAADRLLDERHAVLVELVVRIIAARGWQVQVEVSFSEYGERGSIDIFAAHHGRKAVAVCEVKSVFGSVEETNRILDVKERLAPKLAARQFGWRPVVVGRLLILPRDSSVRRVIESHETTMRSVYPARSLEVRAWLRRPTESIRGVWFVSDRPNGDVVAT